MSETTGSIPDAFACIPCQAMHGPPAANAHCERVEHPMRYLTWSELPTCVALGHCAEKLFSEDD